MKENNILSQLIDYMKPKAHDAIDKLIAKNSILGNWGGKLAEMLLPHPVEEYPVEGNLKDMIEYHDILENREKTKDSIII